MTPEVLVGLLAEPTRMRVFAAVVLGATSPARVTQQTAMASREVAAALRRLTDGGLLSSTDGVLVAHIDAFKASVRHSSGQERAPRPPEPDRLRAAVLRAFVADGRLVAIPVAQGKRRIVLEHVVATFEPGVRYVEGEVNALLLAWHSDHATLRRYLVDEDLMARERGVYWRIGGPVLC